MHEGPKLKTRHNPFLVSAAILPADCSTRTLDNLQNLKRLADLVVSCMRRYGYRELLVEIHGSPLGLAETYRVDLKPDKVEEMQ